jgi:hypothetical protein
MSNEDIEEFIKSIESEVFNNTKKEIIKKTKEISSIAVDLFKKKFWFAKDNEQRNQQLNYFLNNNNNLQTNYDSYKNPPSSPIIMTSYDNTNAFEGTNHMLNQDTSFSNFSAPQPSTNNIIEQNKNDSQFNNVASKILNVSALPELGDNEYSVDLNAKGLADILTKDSKKVLIKDINTEHAKNNLEILKTEYKKVFIDAFGEEPSKENLISFDTKGGNGRISNSIKSLKKLIEGKKDKNVQDNFKRFSEKLKQKEVDNFNNESKQALKEISESMKKSPKAIIKRLDEKQKINDEKLRKQEIQRKINELDKKIRNDNNNIVNSVLIPSGTKIIDSKKK